MGNVHWSAKVGLVFACLAIFSLIALAIFRANAFGIIAALFAGCWIVLTVYGIVRAFTDKWFYAIPLTILLLLILVIFAFPGLIFKQ